MTRRKALDMSARVRECPPMTTDQYLTVSEAAELYRVSTKTIRRWVESGQVESVRIGRTIRVARPVSAPGEKVAS